MSHRGLSEEREELLRVRSDFLAHRQTLISLQSEQERSLDKTVSLLSGGGIALLASWAEFLGSLSWQLFVAVGLLVAALVANLISYLFSAELMKAHIDQWDEDYLKRKSEISGDNFDATREMNAKCRCNLLGAATVALNWIGVTAVVVGLVFALLAISLTSGGRVNRISSEQVEIGGVENE